MPGPRTYSLGAYPEACDPALREQDEPHQEAGPAATGWLIGVNTKPLKLVILLVELVARSRGQPLQGKRQQFQEDPHSRELILFHEYFHAETGEGLGASHQTGWTWLAASLIDEWRQHRPDAPGAAMTSAAQLPASSSGDPSER